MPWEQQPKKLTRKENARNRNAQNGKAARVAVDATKILER